jgi:hypothetical protein
MEGFEREVLSRLPLADCVLHLWSFVAQEEFLNGVFDEHRGRCYEKVITFPVLVQLMASALLEHEGSGRASYEAARENGTLTASVWAAFQKLGNLPLKVSEALLSQGTQRLLQMLPDHDRAWEVPASLAGFQIVLFDGKAIKKVMKRLKALWGKAGGLLGGRALVAMHFQKGLVLAMATHEDGDANDARFVPDLLGQVRRDLPGVRLYVGAASTATWCKPNGLSHKATISWSATTARTISKQIPLSPWGKASTPRDVASRSRGGGSVAQPIPDVVTCDGSCWNDPEKRT